MTEREQEGLLRFRQQAIESSINAIAFTDAQGLVTYVNPAFLRMWGYADPSEVIGRHAAEFGSEQSAEIIAEIQERGGWVGEAWATKKSGERFVIEVSSSLVTDGAGAVLGMMGSFIDITERRRVEDALRASEDKYRSLVESAQDPMFTADAEGRYLYVNAAAAAFFGTTPDQIIGKTVFDLFPPDVANEYRAGYRKVIKTGKTIVNEDFLAMNGRIVWFSSVVQPVYDGHGPVTMAQAIVRDITKVKQAEEAMRESEERLRQAIRVSNIGIFDHDHLSDSLYLSAEQRKIIGWTDEEPAFGADFLASGSTLVHPEDRERVLRETLRAHEEGDGVCDNEYRIIRRDGTVRWVTVRSQTYFDGVGDARRAVRTIGATRDITEQKQAEEERTRLHGQLAQGHKMESVGRLAGGVAHDFNNMLGVILGHVDLLMNQMDSKSPVYADLSEVKIAAQRSADLTRQLLAFARKQPVAPKVLNLNDVVAGSLQMLRRLIGEDISLVWIPGHDLWSVRIDPTQIHQVLANLAANARDAIAGVGQLTIRTKNVTLDDAYCAAHSGFVPGKFVALEVVDDGHGMDQETQAHIFEPFYTTKPEGQGTGLGLATVYGVVKQNDGSIELRSEVGRGTTVRVFLPWVESAAARSTQEQDDATPPSGKETVLLVEDEEMVLRLNKRSLERLGYAVLPANSPHEAIRLAEEHAGHIQLLITDVVMPKMNGRDLAERLGSRDPQLKKLFVSGYSANALMPRGVLDEGVHFLQKPFSINDLATKVREVLDGTTS